MQKIVLIVMIILMAMTTGCSNQSNDDLKSENVFNSFSTQKTDSDYQMEGTVYLSSERDLVYVEANADTEISISGTLKRKEGEIKLLFEDTNGNITILIDSESNKENTIKVDLSSMLNEGNGRFYFEGNSCIFDFDLKFSLKEEVNYFLNNT